jgi:hypothetical protein
MKERLYNLPVASLSYHFKTCLSIRLQPSIRATHFGFCTLYYSKRNPLTFVMNAGSEIRIKAR